MNDVQTLRAAAQLMRRRAQVSDDMLPSPWRNGGWDDGWVIGYTTDNPDAGLVAVTADYLPCAAADHIASWHPLVAAAVANWLDHEAEGVAPSSKALAVARIYLGGAA